MEHIAIMRQPFYDMVLSGEKTIESRWSMNKSAPFNRIKKGDVIYFKKTGCPITAVAEAAEVRFYNLTPSIVEEIAKKYGKQIGTDKFKDYESCFSKKYLTLIWLKNVRQIAPIEVPKSYGAGWIILGDQSGRDKV